MQIRSLAPEDGEDLLDLYTSLWQDDIWDPVDRSSANEYLDEVLNYDSSRALVAEEDDMLVGLCIAHHARYHDVPQELEETIADNRAAYLAELGVRPSHQHQHVGTELLERMLKVLQHHYDVCLLRTHPDVEDAVKLYEHHGFNDTGVHDDEKPERIYMAKYFG